ncbi:MAG: DUF58 domain-containing protein [Bacteroidales bacterium]
MKKGFPQLRFSLRFYLGGVVLILMLLLSWLLPFLFPVMKGITLLFCGVCLADGLMLFIRKKGIEAGREVSDRLSNGDPNPVKIILKNNYPFNARCEVIDEVPDQFQIRNFNMGVKLTPGAEKLLEYTLTPKRRGEYQFGYIRVFVVGPVGMVIRRYSSAAPKTCKVYPGFLQMRRFELLAASERLTEAGIKTVRRLGHQLEFDQIRDYVSGDDFRTVNWKATALRAKLMVNQYRDEKAQPVYSLIDMGRNMKMPFGGMHLLDYAINASLVISNIAMLKQDKAGILTFNTGISGFLPADRKNMYVLRIMEMLYKQETNFQESDFEKLYAFVSKRIRQRSLLILYTNFESRVSMERIKPVLLRISRSHPLLVILFENTEINTLLGMKSSGAEEIYTKTIAEQLVEEKRQMVKELNRYGIFALLTAPEKLNVNLINRYLEFKATGVI